MVFPIDLEPLKGFRDYYPKDFRELEENLFKVAKEVAASFGFEQIDMPLIEKTDFLLKKSGEEIKEQIFNILPKKVMILINKIKNLSKEFSRGELDSNDIIEEILITNLTKLKEYWYNYKKNIDVPLKENYKVLEELLNKEKELKEKNLIFNFEELGNNYLKNNEFLLKFGDDVYLISIKKLKDDNLADLISWEYDFYLTVNFEPLILIDNLSLNPEMSLRFDLTMPAVRMAMKKYKELVKPIKWFYIAKNYRYEEPQKGRDREFFQIGVEFFGEKNFIADLEVLNFAITFLNKIGLKGLYKVKVNDRRLMDYLIIKLIGNNKEKKEKLYRLIDKVRKINEEKFKKEALKILENEEKVNYLYNLIKKPLTLDEAKKFIRELFRDNLIEKVKEIINNKDDLKEQLIFQIDMLKFLEKKAKIEFDLSIVRGLDYYTGFVFEIYDKEEKYRSLAGGGRYDNLAEILGFKEKIYATGLALGPSVLEVFMKEKGIWAEKKEKRDFIIVPISKNEFFYAYEIAEKLRENGFKVEFAYKKGISKNLDYANKLNTKFAIIIGEEEKNNIEITLKDLESGEEIRINKDLFIERVKIDKIDKLINDLLEKRFETVLEIGKVKEKFGLNIEDKNREKEVIENFKRGKFPKEKEEIIKKIIEESKKLQK